LITGATGSIGSKLVKNIIKAKPKKIIICDMDEFGIYNITREANLIKKKYRINCKLVVKLGNLTNINFVSSIFYNSPKVDYIYHCAAYKHVDIVEENFSEGFYNNVKSTLNLLEMLKTIDYKSFILISTDKAVDPINIMGATKRLCEKLTLSYNDNQKNFRNKVIRFGNVFASKGSAIPLIFNQIKNDEFVTITNAHMTRYFLTSEEACSLIISASKFKKKYGDILLFDMGKAKNILQIAKHIATILNKKIRIRLIGVRPGEKIHEKLHNQKRTFKTNNKSIYAIKDHYYSYDDITKQLNYLFSLYEDNNYRELKLKIMEFARH
jgi:FlaA1/EpsC-like NDP-sugar epimerase